MSGINKVILVGNLGADPESRSLNNGGNVTTIKVATSESWKDKQTGDTQERTEWHRVKFFGRLADIAAEYLRKGKQVYIEGSIRTDKYTDKEGVERYATDIIASELQMLGGSGSGGEGGGQRGTQRPAGNPRNDNAGRSAGGQQRNAGPAPNQQFDDGSDSEIPF